MRDVLEGLMEAACATAYSPNGGESRLTILSIEPPRRRMPETRATVLPVSAHRSSGILDYLLRREHRLAAIDA